jgi:hypothetical protein
MIWMVNFTLIGDPDRGPDLCKPAIVYSGLIRGQGILRKNSSFNVRYPAAECAGSTHLPAMLGLRFRGA